VKDNYWVIRDADGNYLMKAFALNTDGVFRMSVHGGTRREALHFCSRKAARRVLACLPAGSRLVRVITTSPFQRLRDALNDFATLLPADRWRLVRPPSKATFKRFCTTKDTVAK